MKKGDSVYLSRRNIKTKRPNDKLDYKKLGLFKIIEKISEVNYKLDLPDTMRIYPVFHITLLELALERTTTTDEIEIDPEKKYEVENIVKHKTKKRKKEYLIK